jgi:ABC-type multidrug transport system permease subunit
MEFSNNFPHLFAYVRLFLPRAASYIHGLSIEIPFRVTEIAVLFFVIYIVCVFSRRSLSNCMPTPNVVCLQMPRVL